MEKKRVLITGASGLLGSSMAYAWRDRFDLLGLFHKHAFDHSWCRSQCVDLTRPEDSERIVKEFKPDICVHCAAMADIDRCEVERETAYQSNVEATRLLVNSLRGRGCKLVFISTDAVYGGEGGNFVEDGPVSPLNYYAETKLQAESEAAHCSDALIVRTSFFGWNLGAGKISIAEWAFNELSAGRRIRGFTDVMTSSIYTLAFADLLEKALARDLSGIFNVASSDSMSKDMLVRMVAHLFKLDPGLVDAVSIDQFPLKAKRSKNLSLSSEKLASALGVSLPKVKDGLERFYQDRQICSEFLGDR